MAAYAVHELTVAINNTGETYSAIAGLETVDITVNGEVQEWTELNNGGWKSRLLTGKDLEFSFSGKRIEGDTGNDYITSLVDEITTGANSSVKITWPNGDILTVPCVVNVTSYGGGGSLDVGALEFSCLSNGQPTFSGNFSA